MFERRSHSYKYRSSSLNYTLLKAEGLVGKEFHYNGANDWNNIPREVQEASNVVTFKKKLKEHLLKLACKEDNDICSFY